MLTCWSSTIDHTRYNMRSSSTLHFLWGKFGRIFFSNISRIYVHNETHSSDPPWHVCTFPNLFICQVCTVQTGWPSGKTFFHVQQEIYVACRKILYTFRTIYQTSRETQGCTLGGLFARIFFFASCSCTRRVTSLFVTQESLENLSFFLCVRKYKN